MAANMGKYVEEANLFIKKVAKELGNPEDTGHAIRVTTSVLQTLRERISVEESFHVVSQLPMILKGIYVDGWNISKRMNEADTLDEFLNELREHSQPAARDFGNNQQAVENFRAVVKVMKNYITDGEIEHIKEQLPEPIAALFDA